ncbi:MAG: hypothetical protein WHS38_07575 [Thermodesulforhabdaceae bacterium]|jgi:hypothetical protein
MAEIKSTIELVMERTKHLIMSSEEKERQQAMDVIEKIPGHIQKFLDRSISEEAVISAYREIPEAYRKEARKKVLEATLERIDLETAPSIFALLQKLLGEKDPLTHQILELREIQHKYGEKAEKLKEEINLKITARLAEKNISGDAVFVIPEETPAFMSLTKDYERRWNNLKQQILSSC